MVMDPYLQSAHHLGHRIATAALWHGDHCTWLQADGTQPIDGALYEGTAGVAWFLAQLAAVTGDPLLKRTAEGAAHYTLLWAESADIERSAGLYTGVAGALWAVTTIAQVLQDNNLSGRVDTLIPHLLPRPPVSQAVEDIVAGQAGTLLALTGLARLRPAWQEEVKESGVCLAGLVEKTLSGPTLQQAGDNAPRLSVGLAHGASGLVWALLELYELTERELFLELARQGLRYERAWFDRLLCTWRDPVSRSPLHVSWCNGSSGMGLLRLRALTVQGDSQLEAEVGAVLAVTHSAVAGMQAPPSQRTWEQSNCSVCHGLMGMADFLLLAAKVLGVGAHMEAGQWLIEYGKRMATQEGEWPCGTIDGSLSYGLMLGLAGIGAVLLRYADATQLPPIGLLIYSTSEKNEPDCSGSSGKSG